MLKVGIIALNKYDIYGQALKEINNFEVVGIYEPSFVIKELSVDLPNFDFDVLMQKSDLLVFTDPNNFFYPLIIKSLHKSKNIILDNVYKFTYEQIETIANLTKEGRTSTFIIHNQLYSQFVKLYLDTQMPPLFIDGKIELESNSNILNVINEEINVLLNIIKSDIRKIRTNIFSVTSQVPDLFHISLEFNNGCLCNIRVSSIQKKYKKEIEIIGTNAQYKFNLAEMSVKENIKTVNKKYKFNLEDNTFNVLLCKQFYEIYEKIIKNNTDYNPLHTELETSKIINKIRGQLKMCNNLLQTF